MSLPIPGWHFVGVPGFIIAAAVLGTRRLGERRLLGLLRGPCPACGSDQEIDPPRAGPPGIAPCPSCGAYLSLGEETGGAGSARQSRSLR